MFWLAQSLNSMFGFIWKQPVHVSLRQMRLLQVGLVINSQWLLWVIVGKLEILEPTQAAVALGAIAAALIAQIWAAVGSVHKSNVRDD